jgi:AraC-like DNA-binding protein
VRVAGDHGAGALCSAALRCLPAAGQDPPGRARGPAGHEALDLLAAVMADLAGLRLALPRQAQLVRARRYIADHLSEPDLSAAIVAEALGMSIRYLYQLFRDENESPFRWILRRRLELAAGLLTDSSRTGRSITDIAFSVGFKDTAHFSRAFKDWHGLSPRDYRERAGLST